MRTWVATFSQAQASSSIRQNVDLDVPCKSSPLCCHVFVNAATSVDKKLCPEVPQHVDWMLLLQVGKVGSSLMFQAIRNHLPKWAQPDHRPAPQAELLGWDQCHETPKCINNKKEIINMKETRKIGSSWIRIKTRWKIKSSKRKNR